MQRVCSRDKTMPIPSDDAGFSGSRVRTSVGAHGLDVSGLLTLVADTFGSWLGWAVAAQVANLPTCAIKISFVY